MPTEEATLETLRFMVETHRTEFERRRSYEWKGFLTGLTFFVLVASDLPTRPTWTGFVRIGAGGFWGLSCESAAILVFAVGCGLVVTS